MIKHLKKFLYKLWPDRLISTFFGIGYLPEWQTHWSAFTAIFLATLIIYIYPGLGAPLPQISATLIWVSLIMFILGALAATSFKKFDKTSYKESLVTIDSAGGQILVLGLATPAILYFSEATRVVVSGLCKNFFYCTGWLFGTLTYTPLFLFVYFVYRIVEIVKIWPASYFEDKTTNAVAKIADGYVSALYTVLILYLIGFIFTDLTSVEFISYFSYVKYYMMFISDVIQPF